MQNEMLARRSKRSQHQGEEIEISIRERRDTMPWHSGILVSRIKNNGEL
jgi:hypothetical protein